MGRKIGSSRPMVLDVLLPPFTEMFCIRKSDATHQWHYDQTGQYIPDRATSPLLLTPELSVADPETNRVYTPSFYQVRWYALNSTTGEYDIAITNTTDGDVDYIVLPGGQLKVKKNVVETAPVSLLCEVQYIDPRNSGKTYTVRDKVALVTSRDTSVTTPRVTVDSPSIEYNPFVDGYTQNADGTKTKTYTLHATVRLGDDVVLSPTVSSTRYQVRWYAIGNGVSSETLIDTTEALSGVSGNSLALFPAYRSGQNTPTLVVDAMFCESLTIVARVYDLSLSRMYPDKSVTSLRWESFKVDATTEAIDGGAVKQGTQSKTFRNIVTLRNRTLSQDVVNDNFIQSYRFRKASRTSAAGTTPTDSVENLGTGPEVVVDAGRMRQNESSLVYAELELQGPFAVVVQDDMVVVQDGKVVVCRK